MKLRDYQRDIFEQLTASNTNDIVQLDTGAGKTPIESALAEWSPLTLLVAHRNILIQQISEKLAAFGLEHDTISTEHTRRRCMATHRAHGRNYIRRGHKSRLVASMQSIVSALRHHRLNIDTSMPWLIVIDEAHHAIPDNMWGSLREIFPHARIVGFTATPARMDGESLHASKGGLFDRLVQARKLGNDSARVLIDRGYLSPFKVYAPAASDLEDSHWRRKWHDDPEWAMAMEAIGWTPPERSAGQAEARRRGVPLDWRSGKLKLVGDPVKEYMRLAKGRPAIMMCPAIKNAEEFAKVFRGAGVPAACINSTQSPVETTRLLDAFRRGRIHVLTNVDMVGEGFDLPRCEVLIIATQTASFPRYRQWCGRVLRPDPEKDHAIIIDHAQQVAMFGAPDEPVKWDLLKPPCGPLSPKMVPCGDCGLFFLFKKEQCPDCGWHNKWLDRNTGFAPGSYVFDIKILDYELVSKVRQERDGKRRQELLRRELLKPHDGFGVDLVGKTLTAIAAWFPRALQEAGVETLAINQFLQSQESRKRDFYINNFTALDAKSGNHEKALKVYNRWLKSQ